MNTIERVPNRLITEKSPYLLQHAYNPVQWYPWCEEAFQKAKSEDKPIFLSIGYSTCHWCHVMAHESFEDAETAELLSRYFVSIKVDREERPDVDSVYMSVCQAFTGSGGWPTSIFMTSEKKPFYAGTYFPLESRYGMPSFINLLSTLIEHWNHNRSQLLESAEQIIAHVRAPEQPHNTSNTDDLIEKAVQIFSQIFDSVNGGFGSAPKFPTPHNLIFLTLYSKVTNNTSVFKIVDKTLMQMRKGGIFDHIGYGFSRYSTDDIFLAPHFEKMLYDNALLIIAYGAAYQVSENKVYLDTCKKTADYILREMTGPEGGFYCAQDADSEGVEGKFYTFRLDEITTVLGEEKGKEFAQTFDITKSGNFEGVNIPNVLKSGDLSDHYIEEKNLLYDYRKKRAQLHLDDKVLTSWNALMIIAMSMLYRISADETYLNAAKNAQAFIEEHLCKNNEIFTSFRSGAHAENGFLDDYAFYAAALIELYNSTFDQKYLKMTKMVCHETVSRFTDTKNGGFYLCDTKNNELFMNPKETYDGAIPSGNSVMAYNFIRLYQLTGNEDFNELAKNQIDFMSTNTENYPTGNSLFLFALLMYENPPVHIVIVPKEKADLKSIIHRLPLLVNIVIAEESGEYALLNGKTTYYVCRNQSCLPPVNDLEEVKF